ncbi:MAG: hypothetical protein QXS49_04975, partial [Ferroplasma sp.]
MVNAKKQLEDFQEQIQKMHMGMEKIQKDNQELTSQIDTLNDKLASCQQREEELKNQNESLNKSLLDANEALEAAGKQNQNMQLELEDRNTELENNRTIIQSLEQKIEMLRAENGQLKDDMENRGASSQDSILKLNEEITKNMKYISELEAKTKQMENNIRELSMA